MVTVTKQSRPESSPVLTATIRERIHQAREQYLAATQQFDDFAQTVLKNPHFVTDTDGIRIINHLADWKRNCVLDLSDALQELHDHDRRCCEQTHDLLPLRSVA
jgi:hypothetical protein